MGPVSRIVYIDVKNNFPQFGVGKTLKLSALMEHCLYRRCLTDIHIIEEDADSKAGQLFGYPRRGSSGAMFKRLAKCLCRGNKCKNRP